MEFDEDDLPGWGMGSATFHGIAEKYRDRTMSYGAASYRTLSGYQIVDPEADARARREYQKFYNKTAKGKEISRRKVRRYSRSEKGRAKAKAWRTSEKGKATAKAARTRYLKTEKGQAYLKRQRERYASDPAYAERVRQRNLAWRQERMKDPVYAERVRAKARERARAKASRARASSAAQPESPRPLASPDVVKLPSVG